ncbi:MAG: hypothetical protein ACYC38_08255 [Eubacteriales bacterium]
MPFVTDYRLQTTDHQIRLLAALTGIPGTGLLVKLQPGGSGATGPGHGAETFQPGVPSLKRLFVPWLSLSLPLQ